ncbi:hypothetical protein [Glutamicibacter sp. NPDC087344]|uniref:hypothetical protein n=1 Tax=Glutamicibacter sp. NPDC087344 TaxID=3363994 RepID=UPI0037F673A8
MKILEILEMHLRVMGQRGIGVLCICGWHSGAIGKRPEDLHRAHVAEVLERHVREQKRRAWYEGWGAEDADTENPYEGAPDEQHEATCSGEYTPTTAVARGTYEVAWDSVTDPADLKEVRSQARAEFDRWLAGIRAVAKAEALEESAAKIRYVYELQCPVKSSEDYVHPSVRVAHLWWQRVLGGTLTEIERRAQQIRGIQ